MMAGTLSPVKIVEAQGTVRRWLPDWFVFTPWGLPGFLLFIISANAEANRSPFDMPEGESEIIAGYFIEYSGFKFALFFLGGIPRPVRHVADSASRCSSAAGTRRWPWLEFIPSWFWFFVKTARAHRVVHLDSRHAAALARGSTHELRVEIHAAAGAHQPGHRRCVALHAAGLPRWIVCSAIVVGPYWLLGRGLTGGRTYRFQTNLHVNAD